MNNPHRCVVDKNNVYITFVVLETISTDDGTVTTQPYSYTLKKGEKLIEASPPQEPYLKNKWTGTEWLLDMTEDEAEQARKDFYNSVGMEYPLKPPEMAITIDDIVENQLDLDFRLTMVELSI